MAKTAYRATRVAADLIDSAAVEGARLGRSPRQQLEHWARVGWAISSHETGARRRIEAAMADDVERLIPSSAKRRARDA